MLHCLWFSANRQSFEIVLISLRRPPFEIAFKWSRYAKMLPIFCTFRLKEHNYFREKRERREGKKSGHCPSREEDAPQREATPSSHEGHVTSFHLVREMPGASKTLFPSPFRYGMLSTMYPQAQVSSWLLQGVAGVCSHSLSRSTC